MNTTINHEKLGQCRVLLEVDLNDGKCFKFVESWKVKRTKSRWNNWRTETEEYWVDVRSDSRYGSKRGVSKPHYYALWGNHQNEYTMGVTKITTPSGSNVRTFSSASKKFFELIKASENMTFSE